MMATSGLVSRIHSCDFSKPENTRFQYGSSVLPLSIAAPMAGTCDEPVPATIPAPAYLRFAALDRVFDLALLFALLLALLAAFALILPDAFAAGDFAFALFALADFLPAPPAINDAGLFLPERERLPSTDRPPPSIILA